ncbi:MAG: hypothetical protein A3J48_01760 [Candidatus Doudnabacteria bacterium RIFCSPHIGHO2_02_FULL_46_11]|uniref:Uncharacterized protein n=1 Tax=Candidatus Doudnabacteria bacterium RIFCSPHIGHO2_02_FULL_46_11 TaxID=1817832 RepID=A0A1F5P9P4_9BACT|nr:MAG: hypothetical protein A3J48_01760 [Candidatus Doudnabacteria bacterium RIFCSPHIGHO2_02_FULL_46_11]
MAVTARLGQEDFLMKTRSRIALRIQAYLLWSRWATQTRRLVVRAWRGVLDNPFEFAYCEIIAVGGLFILGAQGGVTVFDILFGILAAILLPPFVLMGRNQRPTL